MIIVGASALMGAAAAADAVVVGMETVRNEDEQAAGANPDRADSTASESDPAGYSEAHSTLASSDCEDRVDGQSNKQRKTMTSGARFLIEPSKQDSSLDYVNYYIKASNVGLGPWLGVQLRNRGAARGAAWPYPSAHPR